MFGCKQHIRNIIVTHWRTFLLINTAIFISAVLTMKNTRNIGEINSKIIVDEISSIYADFFMNYPFLMIAIFSMTLYHIQDIFIKQSRKLIITKQVTGIIVLQLSTIISFSLGIFIYPIEQLSKFELAYYVGLLLIKFLCFGIVAAFVLVIKEVIDNTVLATTTIFAFLILNFILKINKLPSLLFFTTDGRFISIFTNIFLALGIELIFIWLLSLIMIRKDYMYD